MKRHLLPLLLLLLFPRLASAAIYFDPPLVHENEAFDILIRSGSGSSPGPATPFLRFAPGEITVEMMRPEGFLAVPAEWGERVRVDGMPAGTYHVVVRTASTVYEEATLNVLARPFSVSPASGVSGTELLIEGIPRCEAPCATPLVRVGSELATEVRVRPDGSITAAAPGEGVGPMTVTVTSGGTVYTYVNGFYNLADENKPDLGYMEKVLIPLNFSGPGANGAEWRTDIVVRNDGPVPVPTEPPIYLEQVLPDLQALRPIAPKARTAFPQERVEGGVYFYVGRGLEHWLSYASHVRDLSRSATDRGAELPIVRADDTSAVIRLIGVPVSARFRGRLRIYDFDTITDRNIRVLVKKSDGTLTGTFVVTKLPPCTAPPCTMYRAPFAAVDLASIPGIGDDGDVDITISAETHDARLWAFVTVSNNETQRVTLFTPQHATPEVMP